MIADDVHILRRLSLKQANQALLSAWNGGKNLEQNTLISAHANLANPDPNGYFEVRIPLSWVRPNKSDFLYDRTVNESRAKRYAQLDITTPMHLLFGDRMANRGLRFAHVNDGGHRVSAARMCGDTHLLALIPASDLLRLIHAREATPQTALDGFHRENRVSCHSKDDDDALATRTSARAVFQIENFE